MRLRPSELVEHSRKRRRAVDQDLELVARARRRVSVCPAPAGSVERVRPVNPLQPTPVVDANGPVHGLAKRAVDPREER